MGNFQPAGWPTVIPRLVVANPDELVRFLKDVFGARGEVRSGAPAEMRIGDSMVMVSGGDGLRDTMTAFLYVYVEDPDATYQRALAAGAISMEAPAQMPYGDRRAMVRDPWGNHWQIASSSSTTR